MTLKHLSTLFPLFLLKIGKISMHILVAAAREVDHNHIAGSEPEAFEHSQGMGRLKGRDYTLGTCQEHSRVERLTVGDGNHLLTAAFSKMGM